MARDQVRTQVLLLHSEQHTLDSLSSGLDDRYTVHCATTGTEALNTLCDTPIHIIVSAKDLPGMSGVEALREAKKRSPETIGILLANENEQGLEALVSEKEVFQIVKGKLHPADLTKLIENATRQMRLMALADSANDTAANPDNLTAEHIVMETSENGSTIISDGTGSVPILDPQKISASVAVGARSIDVLVLTKDEEFLATVKESTRGLHNVHYANTLKQAEEAIATKKVGVAVVDAAMVGENVEKLTQHLRRKTPRLVNIVAGRRDDGEMLMDLINRGKVYRFLLKPVSPGRARLAIEASVKHHLEAPDAAFVPGAPAGATGGPAKSTPVAGKRPVTQTKSTVKDPAREPARDTQPAADQADPIGDRLTSAFDGDDSSFTETMTGIVTNFGKAFSRKAGKDSSDTSPAEVPRVNPEPLEAGTAASRIDSDAPLGHFEPDSNAGDDGSVLTRPAFIATAAVVAVAVVGAAIWMFSGNDSSSNVDTRPIAKTSVSESQLPNGISAPPVGTEATGGNDSLTEAQLARDAGQLLNPPGNNALELYATAAAASPNDAGIAAEFAAVIDQALRLAETAMLENREADAELALQRVATVDPGNDRLPFLSAQLSQMQLRNYINDARAAIRDARLEDAANTLAAAARLGVAENTELAAVRDELSAARSAQRVDQVLSEAALRVEQGKLIAPVNDNARYFYELVLSIEPGNLAGQQGLTTVASKLVLQARSEIDQGEFDRATSLLNDARQLDSSNVDLAGATQALADARDRLAAEQRRLEDERIAAAERAERQRIEAAEQQAEEQRLAAQRAAEIEAAQTSEVASTIDGAAPDGTSQTASSASTTDSINAAVQSATAETTTGPVPISSLKRLKYVAPKYPRAAERRHLSGWVDIVFTVAADGTTTDLEVRGSDPDDVFVDAALRAVERWEFEPIVENGFVVQKQAGVRMMFAIE